MRKFAPDILRQRLLIEGYYTISVNETNIKEYFEKICKILNLQMYGKPIIFSPGGKGKEENQGYDAFVPLIDSGISVYVWSNKKFISVLLYTCKVFDENKAIRATTDFFELKEKESITF